MPRKPRPAQPPQPPQPRQPPRSDNVVHLRLDEGLRQRLQREADKHHFTVTNEIRVRLLDSFDRDVARGLDDIRRDIDICWHRFSARFLRMELADQLADAVAKDADPGKIKTLSRLIIEHRAVEQRGLGGIS
jgi:hypothetical protein